MTVMENTSPLAKRVPSIDRFRGIVIFCMIMFQFAEHFKNLGKLATLSHHAPKEDAFYLLPNLSAADIIAPMFILAIGLTYIPSLTKRIEKFGRKNAVMHCVTRYLTLIGIGIAMNGVNDILDGNKDKISLAAIVMTVICLVMGIIALILKAAKVKIRDKFYKVYSYYMCFMGVFGIVVAAVNAVMFVTGKTSGSMGHWLVLHHIGFAGLVALPFALIKGKKGHYIRLASGAGLLALFALFHETDLAGDLFESNLQLVDEVADGGFIGGFAWGAMLILYLFFAEEFRNRKNKYLPPLSFIIFTVLTAGLCAYEIISVKGCETWAGAMPSFFAINKGSVSPAFVIVASWISLFGFYIFELFNGLTLKADVLAWWGKNPILMYCIEFAVIGGLNAALEDFFETASIPVSAVIIVAVGVALSLTAYILDKKKIIIKL